MKTAHIKTELPGPNAQAILARDAAVTSPSYPRVYPFVMDHGRGAEVWDVDGNRFLDFAAGIAVCSTGHSHPQVVQAINNKIAQEQQIETEKHRVEVARLQSDQQRLLNLTLTPEQLTKQYLEVLHDMKGSSNMVIMVPTEGGIPAQSGGDHPHRRGRADGGEIDDEVFAVARERGVVHRKVTEERLEERRRITRVGAAADRLDIGGHDRRDELAVDDAVGTGDVAEQRH